VESNHLVSVIAVPSGEQSPAEAVFVANLFPSALIMPATITGTAMAFDVGASVSSLLPLYKDDGTEYQITVGASRVVKLDPLALSGFPFIRPRFVSIQAAARTLYMVSQP
jgi:hypothetical protein